MQSYLITHSKTSIVSRWPPKIRYKGNIKEVDQIQPTIQNEPSRLPMFRSEIRISSSGKCETVEKEKPKDHLPVHFEVQEAMSLKNKEEKNVRNISKTKKQKNTPKITY